MKVKQASEIKIFDSAFTMFTSMSFPTQQVVCQLSRDVSPKWGDKILLKFMDCAYQNNSDDCGLFVLRFYGPVNPMGSCRVRSVYLTTRLLDRLSFLSG